MEKTFIIIIPASYDNSRNTCERYENRVFDSTTELRAELVIDGLSGDDVMVCNLSDFMDGVNNQEIDVLTDSFISYVRLK